MNVIVFDTETNGLKDCSILSISAIKIDVNLKLNSCKEKQKFNRFYFRNVGEKIDTKALEINGLTDEEIRKKREGATYSQYFKNDYMSFKRFCEDAEHFVAHNIDFDSKFIPFELKNKFCTQKINMDVLKIPGTSEGKYRFPSLLKTAEYYKIKMDENNWHGSEYDTYICKEIFMAMFKNPETEKIVKEFLESK